MIDLLSKKIISDDRKNRSAWTLSYKGYQTKFNGGIERYEDLLVSNTRFNNDVPIKVKNGIVTNAIFMAADKQQFHAGVISEFIKSQEAEYLNKPKKVYYLLSTLSIPYSKELKSISINGTNISFCKRKPKHFENEDTKVIAKAIIDHDLLNKFTYVKVHVNARCEESAFLKAKTELDFIRGIWNFTIHLGTGIRKSFGVPDRINKIVYGPCHTLHQEDGSRESSYFWYETHLNRKVKLADLSQEYEHCKKNEKYIRSISKNKAMGNFIKKIFIRYANSLDDEDMTNTFTRLWSLLELITLTGKSSHITTVQRASLVFKDKKLIEYTLNNLRNKRNNITHLGDSFDSSERDAHILLGIINSFICFLIDNIKSFSSEEEYISLLSLPLSSEEIKKQQSDIDKSINILKLSNELKIYN